MTEPISPVGGPPPPNDPYDDETRPEVGPDPELTQPLPEPEPEPETQQ